MKAVRRFFNALLPAIFLRLLTRKNRTYILISISTVLQLILIQFSNEDLCKMTLNLYHHHLLYLYHHLFHCLFRDLRCLSRRHLFQFLLIYHQLKP